MDIVNKAASIILVGLLCVAELRANSPAENMALIPAGTNVGTNPLAADDAPYSDEYPEHYSLTVDSFLMDRYPVTKQLWDEVRSWALSRGYDSDVYGYNWRIGGGKGADHPVHTITFFCVVKWCNARSERDGLEPVYYRDAALTEVYRSIEGTAIPHIKETANGYRLPTGGQWEYAARGGLNGKRFPWGDTISHEQANFWNYAPRSYVSGTTRYHPSYSTNPRPYTSPTGSFNPNGFGLYDMSGNIHERCWDQSSDGVSRMHRGGSWGSVAVRCRVAYRAYNTPLSAYNALGFRTVRMARYNLNYTAGPGGTLLGDTSQTVDHGTDGTPVTAVPDPFYTFRQWSDGLTDNPRTDTNLSANLSVEATFVLLPGDPLSVGAVMDLDPAEMLPSGDLWDYEAASSDTHVLSAAITDSGHLRLTAIAPGTALVTVTARNRVSGETFSHSFLVTVVEGPQLISADFRQHEPWNPRFEQLVVVHNNSELDAHGLALLFSDLQPGIIIENQTGTAPDGRPMIECATAFPSGTTQTLSVVYLSTGAFRPDQYPPTVEALFILPRAPRISLAVGGPNIDRMRILSNREVLLEFESIAGRYYEIDYCHDLPSGQWITVPLLIKAGANRTQWIDHGPPATFPAPWEKTTRYYRVREVQP